MAMRAQAGLTSATVSYRQMLWRRQRDLGLLAAALMAAFAAVLKLAPRLMGL